MNKIREILLRLPHKVGVAAELFLKFLPALLLHRRLHPKGLYLVLTPQHGNLGDHALAYATIRMLKQLNIPFFEITGTQVDRLSRLGLLHILNGYPILFNGGGNLGTLWPEVEQWTREIIRGNPDSPIMILPNTIFYPDTPEGQRDAEKSAEIYNAHPALYLYARERTSYEKMCALYKNVKLVPDIVLYLDKFGPIVPPTCTYRNGCILSLRQDCEKTRTKTEEDALRAVVRSLFGDRVTDRDMVVDRGIPPRAREKALTEQFRSFASAELVVTDRLHGMIFSALAQTPCIVIDSKSPKVRGCYEWIRELGYIRFADSPAEIPELYRAMPRERHYANEHLQPYYEMLKDDIASKLLKRE